MKRSVLLTVTSLVSILLMIFHISDEIARGMEHAGLNMVIPMVIVAAWLYGTLLLTGRRSGYIVMLIVAIFGTGIPIVHMSGTSGLVGGKIATDSAGSFFWVWQNITLLVVSLFSLALAVRCIWKPEWAEGTITER